MATYITITDSQLDPDAPLTSQLAYQWRDNPQAVAEGAAGVPANLLPTVHLGTLTTTSGTTATLSSLVLTPYKFLRMTINGVSFTSTASLSFDGSTIVNNALAAAGNLIYGTLLLDLANGVAVHSYFETGTSGGSVKGITTGYSNATTSITFSGGTFDAGSIRVYGEK